MSRISKNKSAKRGSKKSPVKSRLLKKKKFFDPDRILFLFKKIIWVVLGIGLILWLLSWFLLSGASQDFRNWSYKKIDDVAIHSGLKVKNILIEGRYYSNIDNLRHAISLEKGDSMLSVDPDNIQNNLLSLPWVKQAFIKKILPDTVSITLIESVPMALYQKDKKIKLIDNQGVIIEESNLAPYKDLIIITGVESNKAAPKLFSLITVDENLYAEIERVDYISQRRWNLILKNKTLIKLPENDVAFALKILEDANNQDSLLSKNLEMIDLRDPNRIIIKTKPGQVENYSLSGNGAGSNI